MSSQLAANIQTLLKRKGMKARELADKMGVHESTLSLWMSGGRTPRVQNLRKIAEALEVEVAELWNGPEATPATPVQAAVIDEMNHLTPAQQEAVLALIRTMRGGSP